MTLPRFVKLLPCGFSISRCKSAICVTFATLIILFAVGIHPALGQQGDTDSLKRLLVRYPKPSLEHVQRLQGLSASYRQVNPDSSMYFADKALQMATALSNDFEIGMAYFLKANVLSDNMDVEASRELMEKAIRIFQKTDRPDQLFKAYSNNASSYLMEGNFEEAEVGFNKALVIAQKLKDGNSQANIYANLAICVDYKGDKRKALDLYTQSLRFFETEKDWGSAALVHHNMGTVYSNLEDQHHAIKHTAKALALYKQVGNLKSQNNALLNLAYYYKELDSLERATQYLAATDKPEFPLNPAQISLVSLLKGHIAEARKDYAAAIVFLDSCVVQARAAGSGMNLHNGHATLARIYLEQSQYALALANAQAALDMALEMGDAVSINLDQSHLAKAHLGLGNGAEAARYFSDYHAGRDTLYKQEVIQAVREIEEKYETEKKEREIARQRAQIAGQRLRLSLAFGIIAVLSLLAAWLFHSRRLRQQKLQAEQLSKQLLEEQYGQLLAANSDLLEKTQDSEATNAPAKKEDAVIVLSNRDKTQVRLGDILYIKAEGNYVDIYTLQGRHTDWQMLNHYEDLLAPFELFVRTHRSFMVNRLHVVGRRATEITLSNSDKVPIASTPATKVYVHDWLEKRMDTATAENIKSEG